MSDTYINFDDLKANTVEGEDWTIDYEKRGSKTTIFTPHGGGIEIGSTQLSSEIAEKMGYNFYSFSGLKSSNNGELHITSTNFDEPIALSMVTGSERSVSFHGYSGDTPITFMGGLDIQLRNTIWRHLELAGFSVQTAPNSIAGGEDDNIVNRNIKGAGVQLELTTQQRKQFFKNEDWSRAKRTDKSNWSDEFYRYTEAISNALFEIKSREFDSKTTYKMDLSESLDHGVGFKYDVEKGIEVIEGDVSSARSDIKQNSDNIELKASQTDLNNVEGRVSDAEASINVNSNAITSKVEKTDFNAVEDRVGTAETKISQNASSITSKVEVTDFNDLKGRMQSAESTISQNSDGINLRVRKDAVISSINQSAETIQIKAENINLVGAVTLGTMDSSTKNMVQKGDAAKDRIDNEVGTGTIETTTGAQSRANSAESNAKSYAASKADTAESNAKGYAETQASAAESNAKSFFQKESWKYDLNEVYSDGESHDFAFPPIPPKFHSYMKVKLFQYDMEFAFQVHFNGEFLADIEASDAVDEWVEYSIPSSMISSKDDNVVTVMREANSNDGGTLYKVELEFDSQQYSIDKANAAEGNAKSYTEGWSEQGADVTGSNTSADTAKVNGESASSVKDKANKGSTAKDKIDSEIGSKTLESTSGSQSKASNAESNAKSHADTVADQALKKASSTGQHVIVDSPAPTGSDYTTYNHGLYISLKNSVHLSSVDVYTDAPDTTGFISIQDTNRNNLVSWHDVPLPNSGKNTITLDVFLEAGQDYILYGSMAGNTLRLPPSELSFPYTSGSFEIYDTTSGGGFWYHFFNIQVSGMGVQGRIPDGNTLPASALAGAIDVATNNIKSDSNFYWGNSGFYAIDPSNSNNIVRITSGGIGVSENGGASYSTAMTGDGIVADIITAGFMRMERLKGGALELGGEGNGNGLFRVFDDDGDKIVELDANNRGFKELQIGDVKSDSVVKVNRYNYTFKVDPENGDDDNIKVEKVGGANGQTWDYPAKTAQAVIDSIPKYNAGDITIEIKSGYGNPVYENLVFGGFFGEGTITIDFAYNELQGNIKVENCTQKIATTRLNLNGAGTTYAGIYLSKAMHFSFTNSEIYGDNGSISYGVYIGDNSYAWIDDVDMYEFDYACVRAAYGSMGVVRDCQGLSQYGMYAQYNSTIGGAGDAPQGTSSDKRTYGGGNFNGTWDNYSSGTATPPAPPETTKTWTSTSAGAWRPNFGGQWNEDYPIQGEWSGYGLYKGLWFFPSSMESDVDGKTIKRMRAYIKRKTEGGYSNSQTAVITHHPYASRPSGEPDVSSETVTVELGWGEGKWVTLPSSFHNNFENAGGYGNGIAVYTTNTSATDYMKFEEVAKIEITYS